MEKRIFRFVNLTDLNFDSDDVQCTTCRDGHYNLDKRCVDTFVDTETHFSGLEVCEEDQDGGKDSFCPGCSGYF